LFSYPGKIWRYVLDSLPSPGFYFDRPVVLFQSDDWGRAGMRDETAAQSLRAAGLSLGEHPYDFYSLETSEDLCDLRQTLLRHRDSTGRPASMGMNFVMANLDFKKIANDGFRAIHLLPLNEGLPENWERRGLVEGYFEGITEGVFRPALHGATHFCRSAVERQLTSSSDRGALLRTLWQADTSYIHWRMPWIGYEYWDPEQTQEERFLPAKVQQDLIGQAVGIFARLFSTLPRSACAPGYRSNDDTLRAWAKYGVRVVQNGTGTLTPPHIDRFGLLQLYRTIDFEPATDPAFSLERCVQAADECFARGIPAIVSVHSINFHSTLKIYRGRSLQFLDQFLSLLEAKYSNLLYLHDQDVDELVRNGSAELSAPVIVTRKNFTKSRVAKQGS
jgi:hypothetical protein